MQKLLESSSEQTRINLVRTCEMLMLSIREAAELANLPISFIKTAIKENNLPAKRIGGSQRIKREDLDSFIHEL